MGKSLLVENISELRKKTPNETLKNWRTYRNVMYYLENKSQLEVYLLYYIFVKASKHMLVSILSLLNWSESNKNIKKRNKKLV